MPEAVGIAGGAIPRDVSRRFGASFGGRAPGTSDGGAGSSSSSAAFARSFELGGGQVSDNGAGGSELAPTPSTSGMPRTVIRRFFRDIDPMIAERASPYQVRPRGHSPVQ